MKRELSNKIRWAIEDAIPPIMRDSRAFAWLMNRLYHLVNDFADFRKRAHTLQPEEYAQLYSRIARVHEDTDNSAAILKEIQQNITGEKIIDVGCGTGYSLDFFSKNMKSDSVEFTGVDFQINDETRKRFPNINFVENDILQLPFADGAYDTVLCTHTLEHILDIRRAITELRRICKKRLIIVVPREREGLYTFNPHFHFFPYTHSFLRVMIPIPENYSCKDIGRDIIYIEDKN